MTLRDRMWAGGPALVVGGGHSLRGFDFKSLPGMPTIAVNRAAEVVQSDLWIGVDSVYWRKAHESGSGSRVWIDTGDKRPDVDLVLPCAAPPGTPNRHSALAWGRTLAEGVGCAGNSGYAALNLAVILGADPVYLLGFDMEGEGGVLSHFHSGYREKPPSDVICARWRAAFAWAAPQISARVVVLEVTPGDSRLDCFEKRPVSEVLCAP